MTTAPQQENVMNNMQQRNKVLTISHTLYNHLSIELNQIPTLELKQIPININWGSQKYGTWTGKIEK